MTTPDRPDTRPETQVARPASDATADELVADIEATRAELGDTVDALSEKFDVRTQARSTLDDARERAAEQARIARSRGTEMVGQIKDAVTDDHGNLTPQARAVAVKVAAGLAALVVTRAVWKKVRR